MEYKEILVEEKEGIAKVTLNRVKQLNTMTLSIIREMNDAFHKLREQKETKVVIITGAGRAFCAGGDINEMPNWPQQPDLRMFFNEVIGGVIKSIFYMEKPVIAMVNGPATGAGLNLALACDLIIAAEGARFGEAYVKIGLSSDWAGNYFLPRRIGLPKAMELFLTGKVIDAKEAERIGLINQVVPDDRLESTVMELARQLADGPSRIQGIIKKLLNSSYGLSLESALELENYSVALCASLPEFKEGYAAFLEKRKPVFKKS
jgi:2-(1,2-epoxy-1,2-dihydrophenyl)acetyl-CoA isomerase